MPTYEYRCGKCGKEFSVTHTLTDHDKAKVACPKCKSRQVQRLIGSVQAQTSKKS